LGLGSGSGEKTIKISGRKEREKRQFGCSHLRNGRMFELTVKAKKRQEEEEGYPRSVLVLVGWDDVIRTVLDFRYPKLHFLLATIVCVISDVIKSSCM
jgi:hypothetical protein